MEGGRRKNIIINTNIKLLEWECDSQGWMLFVCDAVSLSVSQSAGELGPRERERESSQSCRVSQLGHTGPLWAPTLHHQHRHSRELGLPQHASSTNRFRSEKFLQFYIKFPVSAVLPVTL